MEIIEFINDMRKMGNIYYQIWLPIVLQFNSKESIIVKLRLPLDVPKSSYYRVINYGLNVFPKHVNSHSLTRNCKVLILVCKNQSSTSINTLVSTVFDDKYVNSTLQIKNIIASTAPKINKKSSPKKAQEKDYDDIIYEEIINFLNNATGKNYKTNSVINRKFITQRLNDGFIIEDFKQVISIKSVNWLECPKMQQFLRPETLFSNKFEAYLNENIVSNVPKSNLKNTYDQVDIATQIYNSQG